MRRAQLGFTLMEVLITVVIVGILSAVAIPNYTQYVTRSRVAEAFSALGAAQLQAEQYWSNKRTYEGMTAPAASANFTYAVSNDTASTYTITATGTAKMTGFTYTTDQNGKHATTATPSWGTNANCWVDKKGGLCSS